MRPPINANYAGTLNRHPQAGGIPVQTEAAAYFARMSTAPSVGFQEKVNRAIYCWKASGAWARVIGLWLHAAETQQAALLCMNTTGMDATLNSTPTFTASKGFSGFDAAKGVVWPISSAQIASDSAYNAIAGKYVTGAGNFLTVGGSGAAARPGAWVSTQVSTPPVYGLGCQSANNLAALTAVAPLSGDMPFCVMQGNSKLFEPCGGPKRITGLGGSGLDSNYRTHLMAAPHPMTLLCANAWLAAAMTDAEAQSFMAILNDLLSDTGAYS